jgi:membrane associated rhomboid family serine protease
MSSFGGTMARGQGVLAALPNTLGSRSPDDKRPTLRRLRKTLSAAPATSAYLLVLIATTAVLSSSSAQSDARLLLSVSTNLHQLAHDPVRVLIASAFWAGGWWHLAVWIALFAAIIAQVERRLGWRRVTIAFAAGHVGATLIVAAGLWIGIQLGATDPADVFARDVGASYGFFAVAALAAYLLDRSYRICYLAVVIGYVVAVAALSHTFSDFGHLTAVAIGLACYPLVRTQGSPRGRPLSPSERIDTLIHWPDASERARAGFGSMK